MFPTSPAQRLLFARSWSVSCYSITTQLLVDDLLVYNGTVNMALRTSSVSATCHTIVFTDVNQHELTSTHTTAIMYASYCAATTEPGLASFIGAKDDGSSGDKWSYKTCKAPVKLSPLTNHYPAFYRPDALPVAQPTVLMHWRASVINKIFTNYFY